MGQFSGGPQTAVGGGVAGVLAFGVSQMSTSVCPGTEIASNMSERLQHPERTSTVNGSTPDRSRRYTGRAKSRVRVIVCHHSQFRVPVNKKKIYQM